MLTGVLWYRLPVAGDRYNWTAESLRAAIAGRVAPRQLVVEVRSPQPGLVEVDLVNRGATAERLPSRVALSWPGAPPIAGDAVGGYRLSISQPAGAVGEGWLTLETAARPVLQRPGARRVVAWLRFVEPQTEIGGRLVP
jgi:hypothetical protein